MSLAPSERRALAGIENSLCRSDPGLAAMLGTFTLPRPGRRTHGWRRLFRGLAPTRRLILAGLVMAAVCLTVGVLLLNGPRNPLCRPAGRNVILGGQTLACPPTRGGAPSQPGHPAGYGGVRARPATGGLRRP